MMHYEPPAGVSDEDELVKDMVSAIMAILDAENAIKNNTNLCNQDNLRVLSVLAERMRAKIKSLGTKD